LTLIKLSHSAQLVTITTNNDHIILHTHSHTVMHIQFLSPIDTHTPLRLDTRMCSWIDLCYTSV